MGERKKQGEAVEVLIEEYRLCNYKIENKYRDISHPFQDITCLFLCQLGLFFYYVAYLNYDPDSHDPDKLSLMKWIVAIMVTEAVTTEELGVAFLARDFFYYCDVLGKTPSFFTGDDEEMSDPRLTESLDDQNEDSKIKKWLTSLRFHTAKDGSRRKRKARVGCTSIPIPVTVEYWCRMIWDIIVNSPIRTIVLITAPVLLAVSENMDFVQNCTAVFFLIKLDDLDDAKSVQSMVRQTKAKLEKEKEKGGPLKGDFPE